MSTTQNLLAASLGAGLTALGRARQGRTKGRMLVPGLTAAVEVIFDPQRTTFEQLARLFLEIHDPTQVDRQGPDVGDQYRSAIFYMDEAQRQTAERLLAQLRSRGLAVATKLEPAARFWPAETYHRDYYQRNGKTPYCHARVKRF